MKTTAADYAAIRDLSKKYDLHVCSIASARWIPKMSDHALHADAEALLCKQIEAAEALGADGILVVAGGKNDTLSLLSARNASLDFLKAQRAEIERCGIFVGVENVPAGFLNSPFDIVFIAISPTCHREIELTLLERNIPFFVQKPMSLDLDQARMIRDKIAEKKLITSVGLQMHYGGVADRAREFAQQNEVVYAQA